MDSQQYYINIDLKELIKYLRELEISEEKIKLIVEYCIKRRDKELEEKRKKWS